MRSPSRYHRSCAVMLASLGASMLALAFTGAAATAAAKPPIRMADAFLVDSTGTWFCPGPRVDCDPEGVGTPATSRGFAEELLKQLGALNTTRRRPLYLRAAKARNDCHEDTDCTTVGVPPQQICQPGASDMPFCALLSLKQANVKLGIVISAKRSDPDDPDGLEDPNEATDSDKTPPRTPSALAWQACEIRQADRAHLYDFVFIDYTFRMGYDATREAVQMIKSGRITKRGKSAKCRSGGKDLGPWPHVMTNDTTWDYKKKNYNLKTGAWAHAKRLGVIGEDEVATRKSGFTANDRQFIRRVHQANSQPVLRLEVTPDTSEFAGLERPLQCSLLKTWAGAQRKSRLDYTLLFPLFVHGVVNEFETNKPYNSLLEETLTPQLSLIAHPNKPSAAGCASRAATSGTPGQLVAPTTPPGASLPPVGTQPPPPAVVAMPNVLAHEPTNLTCHSARLNGWVNPHGSPTRFHFEYWTRGEPAAVQRSGDGDAGAGTARVEIARVIDGLVRKTGYTGRLVASNPGGRAVSDIFSFTTPGC